MRPRSRKNLLEICLFDWEGFWSDKEGCVSKYTWLLWTERFHGLLFNKKMRRSFPTNDVFLKDLFEGFESRSGQTQFFFPNDENFQKTSLFRMPWIEIRHRRALQLTSLIILLLLFQWRLRWTENQVTFPDPERLGREDLAVDAAGQCNPRNESFLETEKSFW